MTIETSDDYNAALVRLATLAEAQSTVAEQDEILAIGAAMLAYETRNHPAICQGGPDDS